MNWEIVTYGNGEFLSTVFNGVVALMGDNNFTTLMRLAGTVGIFWVMLQAALYRGRVDYMYPVWFVLIYGVLFVPKTNVMIVDRLDGDQTRVVANVPLALGAFAGATNRIGDWFTRGTEAVMSLPNDLQYHKSGVVFGSSLIQAASQYEITNPDFSANMSEFMHQCVFYDVLLRRYSWLDLLSAPDPWAFITANTSPVSRAFAYVAADGSRSIIKCQTGANGVLNDDWQTEVTQAAKLYGIRQYRNQRPNITMTNASAQLLSDLPVSYDYLAGISKSGGDIIRTNMLANVIRRSFGNAAASADAGAAPRILRWLRLSNSRGLPMRSSDAWQPSFCRC